MFLFVVVFADRTILKLTDRLIVLTASCADPSCEQAGDHDEDL